MKPLSATALAMLAGGVLLVTAAVVTALWWAGYPRTHRFPSIGAGGGGVIGLLHKERDQAL